MTSSTSPTPIPYATIGTNWITTSFIHACARVASHWTLHAIYSRSRSTATTFAALHSCPTTHTSLPTLLSDPVLQAVYIASPNSLHYPQALACLRAGKHVILEKPATCTTAQLTHLFRTAKANGVILIEAFRHLHEHNFSHLHSLLSHDRILGPISGASLTYASFSSRYTAVLANESPPPNIFSPSFAGGALVDIGVYPIAFAIALFGAPKSATYIPHICRTGVDAAGVGTLQYDTFGVALNISKSYNSVAPVEIYGEKGTLRINATTDISSIIFIDARTKTEKELVEEGRVVRVEKPDVNMEEEVREFGRMIAERDWEGVGRLPEMSRGVVGVTEGMRRGAGIAFPGCEEVEEGEEG